MHDIILAAHRGDRAHAPENTLPAYRAAIALGVDMLEVDIHTSRDGVCFMMHDHTFDRTTSGTGSPYEKDWAEIRTFDAGSWFGPEFAGTPLPTLEETLQLAEDTPGLWINWELKDRPDSCTETQTKYAVDQLVAGIIRHHLEDRSIINSFSTFALEYAYEACRGKIQIHGQGVAPFDRMFGAVTRPIESYWDWACMYPANKGELPPKEAYDACKALGITPCVCIPDTEEAMAFAIENGCKMFTSNDPATAIQILKKLGKR